jgi:hypothetical protein
MNLVLLWALFYNLKGCINSVQRRFIFCHRIFFMAYYSLLYEDRHTTFAKDFPHERLSYLFETIQAFINRYQVETEATASDYFDNDLSQHLLEP